MTTVPLSDTTPRRGSVAAHALARHRAATWLLVTLPFLVGAACCAVAPRERIARLTIGVGVVAADVGCVAVLFAIDMLALASALRAGSRRARGLAPVRRGVDFGIGSEVWLVKVVAEEPYRAQDREEPAAVGSPWRAAHTISECFWKRALVGMAAFMASAMITLTWSMARSFCGRERSSVLTAANAIRSAVIIDRNTHPADTCPSLGDLKAGRILEDGFLERDPWGGRWHIACGRDEITVTSWGPDRKPGTEDDIAVPPAVDAATVGP